MVNAIQRSRTIVENVHRRLHENEKAECWGYDARKGRHYYIRFGVTRQVSVMKAFTPLASVILTSGVIPHSICEDSPSLNGIVHTGLHDFQVAFDTTDHILKAINNMIE